MKAFLATATAALFGVLTSTAWAQQNDNFTGLWVGDVTIDQVIKQPIAAADGQDILPAGSGLAMGKAAMRVILHVDVQRTVRLVSHVAILDGEQLEGEVQTRRLVTGAQTIRDSLGERRKRAGERIIGTVSYDMPRVELPPDPLPGTTEEPYDPSKLMEKPYQTSVTLAGNFGPGNIVATPDQGLVIDQFHRNNPYRHFKHKGHSMGFRIEHKMKFTFDPRATEQAASRAGDRVPVMSGIFRDTVTGLLKPGQAVVMQGPFALYRVSNIAVIGTPVPVNSGPEPVFSSAPAARNRSLATTPRD